MSRRTWRVVARRSSLGDGLAHEAPEEKAVNRPIFELGLARRAQAWNLARRSRQSRDAAMDQALLRSYLATIYELPGPNGAPLRVSLDGEIVQDHSALPEILLRRFAVLTAYNPRSMLLPRKVNEQRHHVLRDLLILGCYRVEPCVGSEAEPDGVWREPAWLVYGMERDEAIAFGRVYRQNTIVYAENGRPEIIVTDPTADDVGRTFHGNWRVRS
jgi:Protein of unknown function (DUF3293)